MFVNLVLYGLGGIASVCIFLLVTFQEKLVYVPVIPGQPKEYPYTPSTFRLMYEDVWLRTQDGLKLHSWFIKTTGQTKGFTILFFQENAGNIAHRLEFVDLMLRTLRCNVFMLSYRGYGASEGSPSQRGLMLDAQAALDHLLGRPDVDHDKIVAFGRSLGGAVAMQLVRSNPGKVRSLILENTFTSILDMAGILLPLLKHVIGSQGFKPLNVLVRSPWRTIDVIDSIEEPILFLSGLQDEMVPPRMMKQLYEKAITSSSDRVRQFVEFPNGMHMDTWLRGRERYWRVIQLFLEHNVGRVTNADGPLEPSLSPRISDL